MSNGHGPSAGRIDLDLIAQMIAPESRVLDIGCGDGDLLALLRAQKDIDGRGVELSQEGVNASVARGLAVVQGDADTDLATYPDDAFDYVILSQTIQATRNPKAVLREMKRIGRRVIVSFPNFGNWRVRLKLLFLGRMPETRTLGYSWYDTPNIHLCTVLDFASLCEELGLEIEDALVLTGDKARRISNPGIFANLFASDAVFLLSRHR